MIDRLRGVCRSGSVGIAAAVLVTACAGAPSDIEVATSDGVDADDLVDDDSAVGNDDSGAGGASDEGAGADGSEDDGDGDLESFAEPRPEHTTVEPPAEVEIDATAIEVATLPIGGSADEVGDNLQCVDVGWSEPPEIPSGATVLIQSLLVEPTGHVALSDHPCPGDAPRCLPERVVTPVQRCTVAVVWTNPTGVGEGSLRASGTIVCDGAADVCSGFAEAVAARGDVSIGLPEPSIGTSASGNGAGGQDDTDQGDSTADTHPTPGDGPGEAEETGEQNGDEDAAQNGDG